MMTVKFTYEWYANLIRRFRTNGFEFKRFDESIDAGSVLLRHDVDWSPRKAVRIAEIESELRAVSTFFFLVTSPFYNVMNKECRDHMRTISSMGHDIGLHFSTHQYWKTETDREAVIEQVRSELMVLDEAVERRIDVVSFHNPPEWVFRKEYEGFSSTYESRFFEDIEYRADSNQRWRDKHPLDSLPDKLQILTHPVLWGERDGWTTDRLREERDHLFQRIDEYLQETDRTWSGPMGMNGT